MSLKELGMVVVMVVCGGRVVFGGVVVCGRMAESNEEGGRSE